MKVNLNIYRLKAARNTKGMTQAQLGEAIGKSSWAIVRLENGERQPKEDELKKLATALNVSTSYLLGISDSADISDSSTVSTEAHYSNTNPLIDAAAIFDMVKILLCSNYVVPVLSRQFLENIKGVIPPQYQLLSLAQRKELVSKEYFTDVSVETPPFALKLDFSTTGPVSFHINDILIFNPLEEVIPPMERGENPILLVYYKGKIYLCYAIPSDSDDSRYVVLNDDVPRESRIIEAESTDDFRLLGIHVATIRGKEITSLGDYRRGLNR